MVGGFLFSFRLPAGKHFPAIANGALMQKNYAQVIHNAIAHLIGAFQVRTYVLRVFTYQLYLANSGLYSVLWLTFIPLAHGQGQTKRNHNGPEIYNSI